MNKIKKISVSSEGEKEINSGSLLCSAWQFSFAASYCKLPNRVGKTKQTFPHSPEADVYFSQLPQFSLVIPCLSLEPQKVISSYDHALAFLLSKVHLLLLRPLLTYVHDHITTAMIHEIDDQIDNQTRCHQIAK